MLRKNLRAALLMGLAGLLGGTAGALVLSEHAAENVYAPGAVACCCLRRAPLL